MQDGKFVILYIDDDQDYLDAVRDMLEAGSYAMVEALSAEEGLRVYKQSNPDLIIVDLMMEEVDAGTSFVKELQALGNKVPVYMLSSVGDTLNMNTDFESLGLDGVFQKPLERETLMSVLKAKLKSPADPPRAAR